LPTTKQSARNATQPMIAVQGWVPLKRPIRCARFRVVCMCGPASGVVSV
jgi:hypothetical protein